MSVTISRLAKSNSGHRVRHPRAIAIFASNNRGGLFAKGVKTKDAFKKNAGNTPLSAGTASAPTCFHGPTKIAHGGKGGAKGGGGSRVAACPAAATAARPRIPSAAHQRQEALTPGSQCFVPSRSIAAA